MSDAFDRHALSVDAADFDAGLAAGVLRLTGKASTPVGGNSDVMQQTQAAFDLRNLSLDQSSVLTLTALPRNWTGPPPQVAVEWSGPLDHPLRNLDASSFVNALAARAIARETARIEAQEFDVHEHAVARNRLQALRRQEAERLQASDDVKHAAERAREREATMGRLGQLLALSQAQQILYFLLQLGLQLQQAPVTDSMALRCIRMDLAPIQTKVPQLGHPHFLSHQQDLYKQFLDLLQKGFAKIGDGVVVWMQTSSQRNGMLSYVAFSILRELNTPLAYP